MQTRPRILVVEDEPGIADTIRYALATDGFEPVCVGTGAEALVALDSAAAAPVALVILDVGLPDVNGFELFKRIQQRSVVPVVFLTARSDEIDRVVGLELGADDYVAKPFSPRELVARVRTILRRAARTPADARPPGADAVAAPVPALRIDEERRRIDYYGRTLELSRYEYGLLRTLAARPGRVWSRDELLARVWGAESDSFDRTVDAHVKTLRAKLKAVAPEVEPIVTHRGTGYALADPLPAAATARPPPPG
jgi:two-component system catabolic regulation response regulator CreB